MTLVRICTPCVTFTLKQNYRHFYINWQKSFQWEIWACAECPVMRLELANTEQPLGGSQLWPGLRLGARFISALPSTLGAHQQTCFTLQFHYHLKTRTVAVSRSWGWLRQAWFQWNPRGHECILKLSKEKATDKASLPALPSQIMVTFLGLFLAQFVFKLAQSLVNWRQSVQEMSSHKDVLEKLSALEKPSSAPPLPPAIA